MNNLAPRPRRRRLFEAGWIVEFQIDTGNWEKVLGPYGDALVAVVRKNQRIAQSGINRYRVSEVFTPVHSRG